MSYKKGIDISRWQTDINFDNVSQTNFNNFVIIKCGGNDDGAYEDSYFGKNYSGFKNQSTPIGAYYFGNASTEEEAKEEARHCLRILENKNLDMPIFYDVESKAMYNSKNLSKVIEGFFEIFKDSKYTVGLYTSKSWIIEKEISNNIVKNYPIWLAWWDVNVEDVKKFCNENNINLYMWQYGTENVKGINGEVDANLLINESAISVKKDSHYYYCHPLGPNAEKAKITTYDNHKNYALDISLQTKKNNLDTLGTPVYAIADGIVEEVFYGIQSSTFKENSRGNFITFKIKGTNYNKYVSEEIYTTYMHLVSPTIDKEYNGFPVLKKGDTIKRGQIVGGMGASGETYSSDGGVFVHLHIVLHKNSESFSSNQAILIDKNENNKFLIDQSTYEKLSIPKVDGGNSPMYINNNWIYNHLIYALPPKKVAIYMETFSSGQEGKEKTILEENIKKQANPISDEYLTKSIKGKYMGSYPKTSADIEKNEFKGLFYLTNICLREFGGDSITVGLYAKLLRTWYMYYESSYTKTEKNHFHTNPNIKTFALFFQEMRVIWVGEKDAGTITEKLDGRSDEDYLKYMKIVYLNFRYPGYYFDDAEPEERDKICALSSPETNAYPMPESVSMAMSWRRYGNSYNYVLYRYESGGCCLAKHLKNIYEGQSTSWDQVILE